MSQAANPAPDGPPAKARSTRGALASLSLCMLLPSLGTSIANVALPTFTAAFGASFQAVQWIVLAYLLANTTSIVSVGRLADLMGRRRLLMGGLMLFTGASLLCGCAPRLGWLIAARAVQGLGAAVLMALAMAFVGDTVPRQQTGRAMGLLGTTSAVGTALGPSLGGALIAAWGWPAIFFINLPVGLLALALVARHLPRASARMSTAEPPRFDVAGTAWLAGALAAYALAMTSGRTHIGPLNVALLLIAAVCGVLFVRTESTAMAPLVQLAALRERRLSAGLAMSALVSTVMMATLVVGPFYLSRTLGLHTAGVGLAMAAGPLVSATTGIPAGRVVDRFGASRMTLVGLIGMAIGCTLLALAPSSSGVAGYVLPLVVLTAHYALFQAANNTSVMKDVAPDQRGVISGLLNLSRNLGLVTGAAVMGSFFAQASGTADLSAAPPLAVAHGMRWTFVAAAALVIVALVVATGSRTRSVPTLRSHC